MGRSDRVDVNGRGLGLPPSTAPPPSVRAAILARVVQQSIGGGETPLLDGRYRLLQEIGRGGAGTVWKAELLPLGRLVAVKLLRPGVGADPKAVSRLMREAMTVSRLGHDHIVQVNDVGTDESGSPYIAMELLEGDSLSQLVARRGRLSWSEVAEIATQICDALSAAHAVGVVHRDVKPANIFATKRDDRRWRCKLLDFGLCTAGSDTPMLTAAGVLLGTPGYAAPEQIRGEAVDGRADLYGLACVMVELLTARPAFEGNSRQEIISAQLAGKRSGDLDTLRLPANVVELIDCGLSLTAKQRHDDLAQFAEAIARVRREEDQPPRPAGETPRSSIGWRGRAVVATTLAGACALAIFATLPQAPDPGPPTGPPSPSVPASISHAPADPPTRRSVEPARQPSPPLEPQPVEARPPEPPVPAPSQSRRPVKRARRPAPPPRAKTGPSAPRLRPAYADGIRDPFAVR